MQGISIDDMITKIVQYADDSGIAVGSELDLARTDQHVQVFEQASGAIINWDKSEGTKLGLWRNSQLNFNTIPNLAQYANLTFTNYSNLELMKWISDNQLFRYLGVWLGNNVDTQGGGPQGIEPHVQDGRKQKGFGP